MAANPFYIDPLGGQYGNIAQGLQGLGAVLGERREEKANQAKVKEAQDVFSRGNPQEISQFMIANPEIGARAASGVQFANQLTEKNLVDSAKRVLSGENPEQVLTERIKLVTEQGGDPSDSIAALEEWRADPEGFMAGAEQLLAIRDPQGYTAWKKATSRPEVDYGATGQKVRSAGLDPATPEGQAYARQLLEQSRNDGGQVGTANRQDFEYWNALKESGDKEGATAFARSAGLMPKEGTISAAAEKALITSQDRYFELAEQSREYDVLADDIDSFAGNLPAGTKMTVNEFFKSVTGTQDEASELRRRVAKVRLSEALKYLPPGPATDRDVAEAFKGVPKENASPDQVKSFLRGSAKIARVESDFQKFKSDYISRNNGTKDMIKAWKTAIENGEVPSVNELQQPKRVTAENAADMSDDELLNAIGAK